MTDNYLHWLQSCAELHHQNKYLFNWQANLLLGDSYHSETFSNHHDIYDMWTKSVMYFR